MVLNQQRFVPSSFEKGINKNRVTRVRKKSAISKVDAIVKRCGGHPTHRHHCLIRGSSATTLDETMIIYIYIYTYIQGYS